LRYISATRDIGPCAFGHLITAVNTFAAMAGQWLKEQFLTVSPPSIEFFRYERYGIWNA
jgi:hypothetical protein